MVFVVVVVVVFVVVVVVVVALVVAVAVSVLRDNVDEEIGVLSIPRNKYQLTCDTLLIFFDRCFLPLG